MQIEPLNGSVTTSLGTCGTAAIALPAIKAHGRSTWLAYNDGTSTVYIGGADVTSSNGLPVGTSAFSPAIDTGNALIYGITAGGAGTVRILEIS